jgi:hypothetical protein
VTITTTTPGAQIYYTITGNTPVVGTGFTKLYTGPFLVSVTTSVKAMGIKAGLLNSSVASVNITITNPVTPAATPVITPASGTFAGPQMVNITCATPGATILYTTNGNVPVLGTGFTKVFTAPFAINSTATIRAIASAPGFNTSAVAVSFVTIGPARQAFNDESENEPIEGKIQVFPNPSSNGRFQIVSTFGIMETGRFSVHSVDGRELLSGPVKGDQSFEIDLSQNPAGLYILRMQDSNNLHTLRLSKQ